MHCSFSVISACNDVDIIAYGRQNNDSVDTESYQLKQYEFDKAFICFQLSYGRGRCLLSLFLLNLVVHFVNLLFFITVIISYNIH